MRFDFRNADFLGGIFQAIAILTAEPPQKEEFARQVVNTLASEAVKKIEAARVPIGNVERDLKYCLDRIISGTNPAGSAAEVERIRRDWYTREEIRRNGP